MSQAARSPLPYLHLLEGRDPAEVLADTPARLTSLFQPLTPAQIDHKPALGKWSIREIQAHLADCEIAWSWRLRQVYGQHNPTLESFDQDAWAASYDHYSFVQARATWSALRAWNITFLGSLGLSDRGRPALHPEYGPIRLYGIAAVAAGHDLHHLKSLTAYVQGLERGKDAHPGV